MQKYIFRKYTSKYPTLFRKEKGRIEKSPGANIKIEHIGSTAVPSLGGKGVIDIAIGVATPKMTETKEKLEKASYEFREKASSRNRLFFRRDYHNNHRERRIHIHLVKFNGKDWKEMINFRNYLLNHPKAVEKYAKLKKEAVRKSKGEGRTYRKHKEKFIKDILRKAQA